MHMHMCMHMCTIMHMHMHMLHVGSDTPSEFIFYSEIKKTDTPPLGDG